MFNDISTLVGYFVLSPQGKGEYKNLSWVCGAERKLSLEGHCLASQSLPITDFSVYLSHPQWMLITTPSPQIQLTLVISTPLISILSLMSNWFLSPDYFPYVFIVFQLRVCRTTFMSTLRLSRPSFSVPEYIFHSFHYSVSRTRTMTKENKMLDAAPPVSVAGHW